MRTVAAEKIEGERTNESMFSGGYQRKDDLLSVSFALPQRTFL